jgi:hypothetical protein
MLKTRRNPMKYENKSMSNKGAKVGVMTQKMGVSGMKSSFPDIAYGAAKKSGVEADQRKIMAQKDHCYGRDSY